MLRTSYFLLRREQMIHVNNISFSYSNGAQALHDVSFTCAPGTITGIIGPNGSGKTTLIKLMAGLLKPGDGEVLLDDKSIAERSVTERSREMAYVAQSEQIPFPFKAFEVVLMGRAPHRRSLAFESKKDIAIALEAMAATESKSFAQRSIFELSGGERQRIILARALAQQPKVMLLDEPTSSLDIRHKIAFYNLLTQKCRGGDLTAVAAMHDINLASQICDQIILIVEGRVARAGTPSEVLVKNALDQAFGTDLYIGQNGAGQTYILPNIA